MSTEPTIVTNWDSMPPEVYAEGEVYSTRVLAARYKRMEDALKSIISENNERSIFDDKFDMNSLLHKWADDAHYALTR